MIFSYFAPALFIVLFLGWKLIKRTKWEKAATMDVTSFVNDPEFTEYVDYQDIENMSKANRVMQKALKAVF